MISEIKVQMLISLIKDKKLTLESIQNAEYKAAVAEAMQNKSSEVTK